MRLTEKIFNQIKKITNFITVMYYRIFTPTPKKMNISRTPKIIISLTTYGKRLDTVYLCIKSLFAQTEPADEIRLYLGDDVDEFQLPLKLKKLEKKGLKIISGCENLKPHKKYFYAMKENPEDIIITVDDDVIYGRRVVEKLYKGYLNNPKCIICTRARIASRLKDGKLQEYSKWPMVRDRKEIPSMNYLPTGVGGILYPPHSLNNEVLNINQIKKEIINADDIWLRCMGLLNGTPVVCVYTKNINPIPIPGADVFALKNTNVLENQNDIYLEKMEKMYNIRFDGGV